MFVEYALSERTPGHARLLGAGIIGEDRRLRFIPCTGQRLQVDFEGQCVVYGDALAGRSIEAMYELASPAVFRCVTTAARLLQRPLADHTSEDNDQSSSATATKGRYGRQATEALNRARQTWRLWHQGKLWRDVREAGLDYVYKQIELPIIDVTVAMQRSGLLVDVRELKQHALACETRLAKLQDRIDQLAGKPLRANYDQELAAYLFDELRLPVHQLTRNGNPSVENEVLESLSRQYPIAGLLLEHRRCRLIRQQIDGLLRNIDASTGRVHGEFDPLGAETGRLTCRSPNLQGLQAELRQHIVAPRGSVLVEADYSQVELRVLAQMSNDKRLQQAFSEGEDVHLKTAAILFKKPAKAVTESEREAGKQCNFAILYGQSTKGLAKQLRCSQLEARELINNFHKAFKNVRGWQEQVLEEVMRTGRVHTLFGRIRRLESSARQGREPTRESRQAANSAIQGTAADILKLALVRLYRTLAEDCKLVLTVHDSILAEVPERRSNEITLLIRRTMEQLPIGFSVGLPVDIAIGHSWGKTSRIPRSRSA